MSFSKALKKVLVISIQLKPLYKRAPALFYRKLENGLVVQQLQHDRIKLHELKPVQEKDLLSPVYNRGQP